jgi:hypothetical protein
MRVITSILFICIALFQALGQEQPLDLEAPFEKLKVSGNIHLELVSSDTQQLIIVSEESAETVDIETGEGLLILKAKSELNNAPAIDVKLHYIYLSSLEITKGSLIQSADTLKSNLLQLDVLSGGKAEICIRVDSLNARVNQGADVILYGSARSQFVNAYTWGNYLAYDLEAVDSYVKAATGAQVKVNTSRMLDASATSKAFVGYLGEPEQKKMKTSVGGEITPLTE